MGAQSIQSKSVSTGLYTQWIIQAMSALTIGPTAPGVSTNKGACFESCDMDERCAAVLMEGLSTASASDSATMTSCTKIYGNTDAGQLMLEGALEMRSFTHAVPARLSTKASE